MKRMKHNGLLLLGLLALIAISVGACSPSTANSSSPIDPDTVARKIKVYESPT
jgi:hypothetical protein